MTFYNHIESVRGIAIDLTNGRKWRGASDKAAVFEALDAARREYMRLSDENAKLRELVRDMMRAWWACDNEVCPRHDERCEKGKYCAFDECAQELGIEVDG